MIPERVKLLKGQATQLKKATGVTHAQALDAIAKREGFRQWSELISQNGGRAAQLQLAAEKEADRKARRAADRMMDALAGKVLPAKLSEGEEE